MKKIELTAKNIEKVEDAWVQKRDVPTEAEATKKLTVRISASLHKKFKLKALTDGVNMDKVVESLIKDWCDRPNSGEE